MFSHTLIELYPKLELKSNEKKKKNRKNPYCIQNIAGSYQILSLSFQIFLMDKIKVVRISFDGFFDILNEYP